MRSAKLFVVGLIGALGLLQIVLYWRGLVAWLRMCSSPYSQIKGTAYEEMWTSLRAVGGIVFLIVALVWYLASRRTRDNER
jgi:hypothetical protein